jgi:hypothetical protein
MVAFEIAVGISERLSDQRPATSGGQGERRQEPQRREQSGARPAENGDPGWDDDRIPF